MRVLLDQNINPRFAHLLPEHEVMHTHKLGLVELLNGDLVTAAEAAGKEHQHPSAEIEPNYVASYQAPRTEGAAALVGVTEGSFITISPEI